METRSPATQEVDLLVIGAGAGGMAAALAGSLLGLEVLVCEKSAQVGGTAATSAGTIWIPGNRQSREAGFDDSADAARRYLDGLLADPADGRALREVYLARGPAIVDWFAERSEVRFVPCGRHPDYLDREGAAVSGRALVAAAFDGRQLGTAFADVRPPIPEFMVFGGMMVGKDDIPRLVHRFASVANFMHAARLFARYLGDRLRHSRGTRLVMGNALVARLYASLLQRKVPVRLGTRLEALSNEGGRITGARLHDGRDSFEVRARRGVVLATGGFARHAALRQRWMPAPAPVDSMAVPSDAGDGIAAALAVGAQASGESHGSGAFWTPVSRTGRDPSKGQWAGLFPHLSLDRAKPGLIAVNAAGRRFANEADSYHHFIEAMFASQARTPSIPAWLVCETRFVRNYGLGAIHPGTTDLRPHLLDGCFVAAASLDRLAQAMQVDAAGLADTVARHNRFAETGIDEDFHKGHSELNRFNGDPAHGPNPCIGRIGDGPYCAMAVWPAEIACSSGLETDTQARVLGADGRPLPGLYACGNDLASIMRGTYPGPGTTLGPALVFGYLAAEHAASQPPAGEPAATSAQTSVRVADGLAA